MHFCSLAFVGTEKKIQVDCFDKNGYAYVTFGSLEVSQPARLDVPKSWCNAVVNILSIATSFVIFEIALLSNRVQREGLVSSCITKNVDALFYGAERTYKKLILQPQHPLKAVVEECTAKAMARFLGMDVKVRGAFFRSAAYTFITILLFTDQRVERSSAAPCFAI